jgi:hypothetical protein
MDIQYRSPRYMLLISYLVSPTHPPHASLDEDYGTLVISDPSRRPACRSDRGRPDICIPSLQLTKSGMEETVINEPVGPRLRARLDHCRLPFDNHMTAQAQAESDVPTAP